MKNQTIKDLILGLLPKFLAVTLATFWAVVPASAGNVQMNRVSDTVIEITGGSGTHAWHLRYGTLPPAAPPANTLVPQLVQIDNSHAYFSHGSWLRLIETEKGVVIGRWHFPGQITKIIPAGSKAQVVVENKYDPKHIFHSTLTFDPAAPEVPYWPSNWLLLLHLPQTEVLSAFQVGLSALDRPTGKTPPEQARKLIPPLEDAVRRDPCSPWFRVFLGNLLRDAGDPRAHSAFESAASLPTTDFSELLQVSTYLDNVGEHDLASQAFERGYQDFLARGNDPRLLTALYALWFTYHPPISASSDPNSEYRKVLVERVYRLIPYGEGAPWAWRLYADYWKQAGKPEEARLWGARAEEAETKRFVPLGKFAISADRAILVYPAAVLAGILFMVILYARYRPQRRLDAAARQRAGRLTRGFTWFNLVYWDWRDRVRFLTIILAVWYAAGVTGILFVGVLRSVEAPVSFVMGSLAGPVNTYYIQNDLPETPERNLFLAFAYQQGGENEKAERLYHALPQFPESWNNLGVIMENSGRHQEATLAFQQALKLDPRLAEAALNLGQGAKDFWSEQHQKYLPARPMIAIPRQDRWVKAVLGCSLREVYIRAWYVGFSGFTEVGKLAG